MMSYYRMKAPNDLNGVPLPANNEERYPPIALPAPPLPQGQAANPINAMNTTHFLETGQIIMDSGPGFGDGLDNGLETKNLIFNDQTIRKGFIRKVYSILLMQLLFTCGVVAIFTYHEPTKYFVRANPIVFVVSCIVNLVVLISITCCETARRHFPVNFVCLGLFTATMALLLGAIASTIDANTVLIALGITALLVTALSIFAIQTKYDFTAMRGVLISAVICLLILSFAGVFLDRTFGQTTVACLGGLVASFLLIYDTQLIVGGTHQYQFNPEDYIFAALTLYIDVVRIFLYVLRFLGRK